jgi:curli biogenesis system outer membrane secretion channel CsgG
VIKRLPFLVGLSAATIGAQTIARTEPLRRIAIFATSDDNTASVTDLDRISALLGSAFLKSHKFTLVDRARLSAVIHEQGLSNSIYADPKTGAALGKIAGASDLLHVSVAIEAERDDGAYLTIVRVSVDATYSLVGVNTARIVRRGTAEGEDQRQYSRGSPITEVLGIRRNALSACADDITQQILGPT